MSETLPSVVSNLATSPPLSAAAAKLFAGGGETGSIMAAMDWSKTSLGPVGEWPQSLKTAVRIMLTSRQAMFVWWGEELLNLYNDEYRSIVGGKHPQALGQPASVVWREIWDEVEPRASTAMKTNEGTYDEALLLKMERYGYTEETYYTFSYSPVPNDEDKPGGIICANTDDTFRIIQERRLSLLSGLGAVVAQARNLDDAAALAAGVLTLNLTDLPFAALYVQDVEGGSYRLMGTSVAMEDHPATPEIVTPDAPAFWSWSEAAEAREPFVVDITAFADLPRGPWDRSPSLAVIAPIKASGNHGRSGLLVAGLNPFRPFESAYREFIELVSGQISACFSNAQAYEEERKRAEALAELDAAKTTFFSNISHEFRTPLTLMLGPTEQALALDPPVLAGEELETLHRNQLRLLKLVNALLDFSRLEAGRMQARFVPTDLPRFTAELTSMFHSAFQRANLEFSVTSDPNIEPLYIDPSLWERIVLNLISNALKFTFEGSIRVAIEDRGNSVLLRVSDTGIGIAEKDIPSLFERFHRVEGARSRNHEGSGIGLAMVHDLVDLHGGEVAATSVLGEGTTFTVTLLKGFKHLDLASVAHDSQEPQHVSTFRGRALMEEAFPDLSSGDDDVPDGELEHKEGAPVVLVADDNSDMRSYVSRILRSRFNVFTVSDGLQALERIRKSPPDLLLTDVMMPGLDGFGLLAAVRESSPVPNLPVIMLSARAGEESRVDGIEAGADDYLVKPFSARELLARVEAHLELGRLRERIERERAAYENVFNHSPLPIVVLRGESLIFDLANQPYYKLIGKRALLGKPLMEALPELEGQGFDDLLLGVMRTGEPYVGEEMLVRLDPQETGQLIDTYWTFVYALLDTEVAAEPSVVMIASEVTHQVKARQALISLAEEAQLANRAKDEFLAMLGHELRNPLSPILTALELLKLKGTTSREQEVIERQVSHLVRLVDDLLDISRITSGKVTLKLKTLELWEIVASAVETVSPLLQQRDQHLDLEVPRTGLPVEVDFGRMRQVVSNLLTNAAKYSPESTRVSLKAELAGDRVRLSVRDQGTGIEADMLVRIFELFAQQRQTLDRSQGGLGLGLSIVKNLVELHGGTVSATSDGPGQGSEFLVILPRASTVASLDEGQGSACITRSVSRRPRVLVVDDNRDATDMLAVGLATLEYDVRVAHDGLSALALAEEFQPQVALLDIGLPVMDGYELASRLQALPGETPRMVAITGYGHEQDRERALAAGFDRHLTKPVSIKEVRDLLGQLLA